MPVRRARVLLVPVLVAGLLTACHSGGQDHHGKSAPGVDPAVFVKAVNTTLNVAPNHVVTSTTLTGTGKNPKKHQQRVEGLVGKAPDSATTLLMSDQAESMARRIGDTAWLYSQAPQVRSRLPHGVRWVRMKADRLAAAGVPTTGDQLSMAYVLRGARSIRREGKAKAEDVRTRRYTFDVDLHRAVCAAPPRLRGDVQALLTAPKGTTTPMSGTAWIDRFHLIRRLRLTVTLHDIGKVVYELRLPGDGKKARVKRPPKDTVISLSKLPKVAARIPKRRSDVSPSCPT
ncbi:MAG: hypothetical protein ACRDN9_06205 [Streptosporangiaceae bacterium]